MDLYGLFDLDGDLRDVNNYIEPLVSVRDKNKWGRIFRIRVVKVGREIK